VQPGFTQLIVSLAPEAPVNGAQIPAAIQSGSDRADPERYPHHELSCDRRREQITGPVECSTVSALIRALA